jgi:hypothetical protein
MKLEHGVDWTKQEALSSVRETHGVEGFLGECVTAWYYSLSLLKPGGNALVWPYINATHCNKGVLDISSQRQLYWLNIAYVVPKSHPFCCQYDIDWKKVDRIKISNYSKQQAFGWRSTHGKLYGNKDFFRFWLKQSGKCGYCDDPRQSVEHLYT